MSYPFCQIKAIYIYNHVLVIFVWRWSYNNIETIYFNDMFKLDAYKL